MNQILKTPDYLFEVSWEICNKVGGINTVVATKSLMLSKHFKDRLILIGPDVWRETEKNPAFTEDPNLFKSWKSAAKHEGLRIRTGRWNIIGNPIAILIDHSTFFPQKDEIFKSFWEKFKLDSLSGPHDYVEASMFGYAAGILIESFWKFHLSLNDKIVAHFHEWMSGAGLLYLNFHAPQIATLFTTHATVVGRSIAGNGMPLYNNLHEYNGDLKARELNIISKHSMEKLSAKNSDCFTTVSEITARECKQLLEKEVDIITPNGFEDSFVPVAAEFDSKRKIAREKLFDVAQALLGYKLPEDTLFIANSGRYEFHNKGIDIFIDSIGQLNKRKDLNRNVVAWVLVPANNYGPRKDLQKFMYKEISGPIDKSFLTHGLHDSDYDQILNEIKRIGIENKESDKVKIIFVPSYLDGNDGIFNLNYYNLLIGFDLTIFPSYYEPWGYTPLESLAFHVPTITTNLAGIGMWVNKELVKINDGIDVFERTYGIDSNLIDKIINRIVDFSIKPHEAIEKARQNAFELSRIALWENLIKFYYQAYHIALSKVDQRIDQVSNMIAQQEQIITPKVYKPNKPEWKNLLVEAKLPEKFIGLDELSKNLWWSWTSEAEELFKYIDPELWETKEHNPVLLLKAVSYERFSQLDEDEEFVLRYTSVFNKYKKYLAEPFDARFPKIAYFSMEFGLHESLKIYSGGLGILAGDYLKEASDSNVNMTGLGFLYRYGYFTQQLSINGEQLVSYEAQNFQNLPIVPLKDKNGEFLTVEVAFPGRPVYAKIWKANVGRIPLYLLDTDFEENSIEDRKITHQLYGGDNEHRLRQEMLLGVGGIRALSILNIEADVYHCNEGHAALIGLERIRRFITKKNFTFDESLEIVRASSIFTTHTPVPAGHDVFPRDLVMIYMGHYPERLKTSWERLINLGRMRPGDENEKFSMSVLAANISQEMNGVSQLHGDVTKDMFNRLWDGYYPEEIHIGYVTNGVHLPTWTAKAWKELYEKEFGKDFYKNQLNKEYWKNIYKVADKRIWDIRQSQRKLLVEEIQKRLNMTTISHHVDPRRLVTIRSRINEDALTIGFARRFATYKRAYLLFKDIDRLAKILNNPEMPVQLVFAGKAHPADGGGQALIRHIVEISNRPEFLGKIIFIQNYDIALAKKLVQGVDVWMNTPMRPLEASGTSGMKAVMNGVLNFSVLDGWWVEGYKEGAGWALPLENTYENQEFQDELDAQTIYNILEDEIMPLFYDRDEDGVPRGWVRYIKNCIANIAPDFTTKRMIEDYNHRFYDKLAKRSVKMKQNDYQLAKEISSWKKKIIRSWDSIEVISMDFPDSNKKPLISGEPFRGEVVLDLSELSDYDVGVELVITENLPNRQMQILEVLEFEYVKREGNKAFFHVYIIPPRPGVFNYGVRIFPRNENLPHRQDFSFLRWI